MTESVQPHGEKIYSDFIWDFGKLPFPEHLGEYFIKTGKISAKIHEIWKIKAIFGLGMSPIYGGKNGQKITDIVQYLASFDEYLVNLCNNSDQT